MGRPSRNRNILVAFYVSREEKEEMQRIAKENDMTFSDYARKTILGKIDNGYKPQESN